MSSPSSITANRVLNWWTQLERYKTSIRQIVVDFHPAAGRPGANPLQYITAARAEEACEDVRKSLKDGPDPVAGFDKAFIGRDIDVMLKILNETWFGIPESRSVVEGLGRAFGELCDLCSDPPNDGDDE